jgi:tetratricopeptide (TPR) repeat protein
MRAAILVFALVGGILPSTSRAQSGALGARIDSLQVAGNLKAAARLIQEERRSTGNDKLFSWRRAEIYLARGKYEDAVTEYATYLAQEPDRYSALEGRLHQLIDDPGRADGLLKALTSAAAVAEDGLQLSLLTSSCALQAGKPQFGLDALTPFAADTQVSIVVLQYAHKCEAKGYLETAVAAYGRYAADNPDSPQHYTSLVRQAEVAFKLEQYDSAVQLYGRLVRDFPDRPEAVDALLVLGRLYLEEFNDPETAQILMGKVVKGSKGPARSLGATSIMAECALRLNELDRALALLDEDTGKPVSYELRLQRAEIRFFKHDFVAAADSLQQLLLEDLQEELANDALALLLLVDIREMSPRPLEVLANALLLERQQRTEEAAEAWGWLQHKAPASLRPLSLLLQAKHRIDAGDDRLASTLLDTLISYFPESPYKLDAQLQLAAVYLRDGQRRRALKTFETAVLAFPQDARTPEIRLKIQRLRAAQTRSPG